MPVGAQRGPVLAAAEARVTRTPLGGAADPAFEEVVFSRAKSRLISLSMRGSQSLGTAEAVLVLRNDDRKINSWTTADACKLEARAIHQAAYSVLLDGFIGQITYDPGDGSQGGGRPTATVTVRGWMSILESTKLTTDLLYENTAWTTVADSLLTAVLGAGFSRSITADAAVATSILFPAGMKLREALDLCRRALNATGTKWEHTLVLTGGVKQYQLYKRDTTRQRTIQARDLLPGSRLHKGDVGEVVNVAVVKGATVPTYVRDRTTATKAGVIRPTLTTTRIAQPFLAPDSPLSAVQFTADRSTSSDPPTLNLNVARNTDEKDVLRRGVNLGMRAFRTHTAIHDEAVSAMDGDETTITEQATILAGATTELFAIDLGATPPTVNAISIDKSFGANGRIEVSYSDDDVSYTVAFTGATGSVRYEVAHLASPQTHRYWRVRAQDTGLGHVAQVRALMLLGYKNQASDATNPEKVLDLDDATGATVSTTGNTTKEMAKFDLGASAPVWVKVRVRHNDGATSASLSHKVQVSNAASPGATDWTDLAILGNTNVAQTDEFLVHEPRWRWLRVLFVDARSGGAGAITDTVYFVALLLHVEATVNRPLPTDAMKGGAQSWDVTGLVAHPGTLEERTYPQPRLSLAAVDAYYWLVLSLSAGTTAGSWWDLDYSCGISLANLVGYWSFEEGTGTLAHDTSGLAHDGTLTGAAVGSANIPSWLPGKVGGGLYFYMDGGVSGNWVSVPQSVDYDFSNALTFAFWIRPKTVNAKRGILSKGNGNPGAYSLFIDIDGRLLFVYASGGIRRQAKSNTALTANTWAHVSVRYDGANVTFRLNGAADGSPASTGSIDVQSDTFKLGRSFDTGAIRSDFEGTLDEVYAFKRVLSDAECDYLAALTSNLRAYQSTDSGTTWAALPADFYLRHRLQFNTHQLMATAEDTASQTTYASLVPNGRLYGGFTDESLRTQAAVQAEADALIKRRPTPPRRGFLVIPFDPTLQAGKRVTLTLEAAQQLGLSAAEDVDVVEASHSLSERATTTLSLDEYPLTGSPALAFASQRSL